MNIRGVGSTVLALALVLGVAACDDNPISEGRDVGDFFLVNPTDATVDAGDTTSVIAIVMNRYGTPTNAAVTAEPCDNKVSAMVDPERTEFESPETFLVIGNTVGASCIVVRGGGLVDTADVRVVPASLVISGDSVILSGEQVQFGFAVLNLQGQPVTGLDPADVTFISRDTTKGVIDASGAFVARAPGEDTLIVRTTFLGVARADTIVVRVAPGNFAGSVSQSAGAGGQVLTFTEGVIPFDADTKVRIIGTPDSVVYLSTDTAAGTVTAAVPLGTPAGTALEYAIVNIGPGQVALSGMFTTTAAANEVWTGTDDPATAPFLTVGQNYVATIGATNDADYFRFTVTEAGSYRLQTDWGNSSDIDIGIINPGFTAYVATGFTAANPERATGTLSPGTYFIEIFQYEAGAASTQYRMRLIRMP